MKLVLDQHLKNKRHKSRAQCSKTVKGESGKSKFPNITNAPKCHCTDLTKYFYSITPIFGALKTVISHFKLYLGSLFSGTFFGENLDFYVKIEIFLCHCGA